MLTVAHYTAFPMVRGKKMRVTAVDECCVPTYPGPIPAQPLPAQRDIEYVVGSGFISVSLTLKSHQSDEVLNERADGEVCVYDQKCSRFLGYEVEIEFCGVHPCLFAMLTGASVVMGGRISQPEITGIDLRTDVTTCRPFALEVWTGMPSFTCAPSSLTYYRKQPYGYLLLPCIQPGLISDFRIANEATTFTITGAFTSGGTNWGRGPWLVDESVGFLPSQFGSPAILRQPLDQDTHVHLQYTHTPPPADTDGCRRAVWTPNATGGAVPMSADGKPEPILFEDYGEATGEPKGGKEVVVGAVR